MIFGGMPNDQREPIKAAFQTHPKESAVRILLATDAASEGVNLQNHCSKLIHFEIPWNPNRILRRMYSANRGTVTTGNSISGHQRTINQ